MNVELQRREVETTYGPAGYAEAGEGLPVVAIHGLPGSPRDFRWIAAQLVPGVRFIALETPGFGGTSAKLAPPSIAGIGDHVHRVLDALKIDRAVLVAHSFGSTFALHAAAHHRKRTLGLALLAPVGLRRHRAHRRTVAPGFLASLTGVPIAGQLFASGLAAIMRSAGLPKYLTGPETAQTLRIAANLNFAEHARNIARLEAPVFLAWTEDDSFVEHEIIEELIPHLPAGPRVRFSSGGHSLLKTRAEEISEALKTWISSSDVQARRTDDRP